MRKGWKEKKSDRVIRRPNKNYKRGKLRERQREIYPGE
jgi:hypothetical protein